MRTVRKGPIVDSAVLFTACTIMGVLQRRARWAQQSEQPLTYTKACTRISQLQTTGTTSSADTR